MQLSLQFSIQPARMFVPGAALDWVANWVLGRAAAHARVIDVQALTLVLPTARAGRRLLELLVDRAEARSRGLLPPRIMTTGGLYTLLSHTGEAAPPAMVQLAWLRAVDSEDGALAFGSRGGIEFAAIAERMDRELMGAGHTFAALEGERYAALERMRLQACMLLTEWGYVDPRRVLTEGTFTAGEIVLCGVVDLPMALRKKIDARNTTVVCLAPEHWRERFDAWGALVKAPWVAAGIELPEAALCVAASAREQADAAVRWLAQLGELSTRDVSVAVVDEEVTAPMEHALSRAGAQAHVALPLPFLAQPVARLLQAAADVLERPVVETFATLVRHADMGCVESLRFFDRYREEHLPERIAFAGEGKDAAVSRELAARANEMLGPLRGEPRALSEWAAQVMAFLRRVYSERTVGTAPDDKRLLDALNAVMRTCEALQRAPVVMSSHEAVRFVLAACEDEAIARDATIDAVEMFGWLELPFDDARVTIVCGANEGKLPASVNADAFLPNSVRTRLGLLDNDQRYARDAYVLSVLLRTREHLLLTMGRRSLVGDPLLPSRLTLACEGRVAAARVQRFFAHGEAAPSVEVASTLSVPEPDPRDEAPRELPVTAFANYLTCPYRFYLKRVLRLRNVDDSARELTPILTGNLMHKALHTFGTRPHESDERVIRESMQQALADETRRQFGDSLSMAIRAQVGQLHMRLVALARWQAAWVCDGWRIAHCELAFKGEMAPFDVDGVPVFLTGSIDRVDAHPDFGVAILDYKTSEKAQKPEEKHLQRGEWKDLQLPLYRWLWRTQGDTRRVQLGYINVGKNEREIRGHLARWNDADLEPAYEVARHVVRQVRNKVFWPMNPRVAYDDFDWICA